MLKNQYDGSVMKAAVKPMCGAREIKFYEQLQLDTIDANTETLKKLVPEYRGTVRMPFRGKLVCLLSVFQSSIFFSLSLSPTNFVLIKITQMFVFFCFR